MASIFWDTNLFIYMIEGRPRDLHDRTLRARKEMVDRGDQLVTSALTVGEVLVHPLSQRNKGLAKQYSDIIATSAVIVPLDAAAARDYAQIRASFPTVRPPDAVQLACAAHHRVSTFVTNDRRLGKLRILGIGAIEAISDMSS